MNVKSDPAPPSAALVRTELAGPPIDDVRLQKLWLATQRRRWRSLAFLSAGGNVDTLPVAELFAKLAWWYRGQPSCVLDLRDMSLRLVEYHAQEVRAQVDRGYRVAIALRSISESPTAAPLARCADAIVLCVRLGRTEFKAVEETIAEVGADRVLGSIAIRRQTGKAQVR
jgi:hypothetical protein